MNQHLLPAYPVDAILLLGPTGVGKSPLGDAIATHGLFDRTCFHLDFGSALRDAVSGGQRSAPYSSDELKFIHGVLEHGLLLENEHFPLAEKIIKLYLARVGFSQGNVLVLNGIPRHAGQAANIASIADIHALIVLECSADEVFCRIRNNIGGDRTERVDDNKELIEKKLKIFRERTAPLIEHYKNQGRSIYTVRVTETMTPEEALGNLSDLAAGNPPVSFIAEPPQR